MMPDLSQDISTEQTTWEEIMQIKAMPVPMSQKKEMKAKILVSASLQDESFAFVSLNWCVCRGVCIINYIYK